MSKEPIILVVDDEEIERKMITRILEGHLKGRYRIMEAPNGPAAIQLARGQPPQIVVMDIQMPVMNGLDALAAIGRENRDVYSIILTAHNEFEYAVEAVKLGVEDYILKPVRRSKLVEAIARIEEKMSTLLERGAVDWKKQFDFLFPYIEDNIISGIVMDTFDKAGLRKVIAQVFPAEGGFIIASVDDYPREVGPKQLLEALRDTLARCGYEVLGACLGRQVVLLVQAGEEDIAALEALIREAAAGEVKLSLPIAEAGELPMAYRQMTYSAEPTKPERISNAFSCSEKEIAVKIATQQRDEALALVEEMLFSYRSADTALDALQAKLQTRCVVIDHYLEMTVGSVQLSPVVPFHQCQDREELKRALRAYVETRHADVQESQAHRTGDIVEKVITDMEANFHDGFYSLSRAADNLEISSTYLSKVFKDHMGKTFTEYLSDIRIDEAKKYLHDTELDIAEIAQRCGFNSANYFCKVYKKLTGTSASGYRSSLVGGG